MRRLFQLLLVTLALSACGGGGDGGTDNTMALITIASGDGQTGTVGAELANLLIVTVLNKSGQPVSGQTVNFVVTAGGGTVFAASGSSDANGQVRDRWTLGHTAGPQKLEIRASASGGTPSTYATFNATAKAGAPAALSIVSGNSQRVKPKQALPLPLKVLVKDT